MEPLAIRRSLVEFLEFWFAPKHNEATWFAGDAAFDDDVITKFSTLLEYLRTRGLHRDIVEFGFEYFVAFIILMDQVPRHVYRNSPRAYAQDDLVEGSLRHGLIFYQISNPHTRLVINAEQLHRELVRVSAIVSELHGSSAAEWSIVALFLLLPLQHTTRLESQKMGVRILMQLIMTRLDGSYTNDRWLSMSLIHQIGHFKCLQRFGRFPKRYRPQDRTTEEQKYVKSTPALPY